MNIFTMACVGKPIDNWESNVEAPYKPANWKQETYIDKLPELRAKQRENLDTHFIAYNLSAVVLMKVGADNPEAILINNVTRGISADLEETIKDSQDRVVIIGRNPHDAVKHIAWTANKVKTQMFEPWVWFTLPTPKSPQFVDISSFLGITKEISIPAALEHFDIIPSVANAYYDKYALPTVNDACSVVRDLSKLVDRLVLL